MSFFHCLREPLCFIPTYTDTYGFLVFPSISLPLVTWCAFVVPRCGQAAQTAGTKPRGPRCSPWLGCRQMCRSHPFLPHLWFAVLDNTQTVLSLSSLTKHEHPARPSRCLCLLQGDLALLADGVDSDVNSKWVVLVHFCSMSWYDQLKYFFRAVTQHASAILSPYDFGLFFVYYFGLLWFTLVYFGLFWLYFEYFGIINSAFLLISWLIGWGLHCLVRPCWCMAQLAAAILWYKIQNCTHIMKTSTYYYHIYHIYIYNILHR